MDAAPLSAGLAPERASREQLDELPDGSSASPEGLVLVEVRAIETLKELRQTDLHVVSIHPIEERVENMVRPIEQGRNLDVVRSSKQQRIALKQLDVVRAERNFHGANKIGPVTQWKLVQIVHSDEPR